MPTRRPRPVYNRWREQGALSSWLHQQGQVVAGDYNWLYMSFGCDDQLISLLPHLVRVLDEAPDGCWYADTPSAASIQRVPRVSGWAGA